MFVMVEPWFRVSRTITEMARYSEIKIRVDFFVRLGLWKKFLIFGWVLSILPLLCNDISTLQIATSAVACNSFDNIKIERSRKFGMIAKNKLFCFNQSGC